MLKGRGLEGGGFGLADNLRHDTRAQTQTFESRYFAVGWGSVYHVNGGGSVSSVSPSDTHENQTFGRDIRDFCWDVPGAPEKFF